MLFEDLYKYYRGFREDPEGCSYGNKVRLNLSKYAADVLKNDIMIFESIAVDKLSDTITSKRVNMIFSNYYKDAEASIYYALLRKKTDLENLLGNITNKDEVIERLLITEEITLIKKAYEALKGKGVSNVARVNFGVMETLFDLEDDEKKALTQFRPIYVRNNYDKETLKFIAGIKDDKDDKLEEDEEPQPTKKKSDIKIARDIVKSDILDDTVENVKYTAKFFRGLADSVEKLNAAISTLEEIGKYETLEKEDDVKKEIMHFIAQLAKLNSGDYEKIIKQLESKNHGKGKNKSNGSKLSKKTIGFLAKKKEFRYIEILCDKDLRTLKAFAEFEPSDIKLFFEYDDSGRYESEFYYGGGVPLYIKAVIEEYAKLPLVEREKIYYKKSIDKLMYNGFDKGSVCKIKVKSSGSDNESEIEFRPFFIEPSVNGLYNYVAGYKKKGDEWVIWSLSLRGIEPTQIKEISSFARSDIKAKELRKAIDEYQIEYLISVSENKIKEIQVEFTTTGEKWYKQKILHMRPMYAKKEGLTYTFECTETQAEYYFTRFGKEAKVISPESLAKKLRNKFYEADKAYSDFKSEKLSFGIREDSDGNAVKCVSVSGEKFEYEFEFDYEKENYIFVLDGTCKQSAPKSVKNKVEGIFDIIEGNGEE